MFGLPNPYLIGGVSLVIAGAIGFGAVQTSRLNHAKADLVETRAELLKAAGALRTASEAIRGRDALLVENGAHEASDAGELASALKGNIRDAFQAGRASVRCDGSQPSGVRDLRALWEAGAYRPASASSSGERVRSD